MLSAATRTSVKQHAASFAAAQPYRHAIIDRILDDSAARALWAAFPNFDEHVHTTAEREAVPPMIPNRGEITSELLRILPCPP